MSESKLKRVVVYLDGKRLDIDGTEVDFRVAPIRAELPRLSGELAAFTAAYSGEADVSLAVNGALVSYIDEKPPARRRHWLHRLLRRMQPS